MHKTPCKGFKKAACGKGQGITSEVGRSYKLLFNFHTTTNKSASIVSNLSQTLRSNQVEIKDHQFPKRIVENDVFSSQSELNEL